jgi:NAD(P)-dependent dehydrogenase (short-subunit alcohol dehydrogenase family)
MTVSFITGTSTGIGYATALRLARDGHRVIATMRSPEQSDLATVASGGGLDIEVRALDVTSAADVDEAIAAAVSSHGQIDVLVNNAGITGGGALEEADFDVFANAMETNFFGALRCTKAVLPAMRERNGGTIVAVTSQAGRIAVPTMAAYTASKYALEAALEALAVEVAKFDIRVALIEPGAILTPMVNKNAMPEPESKYRGIWRRFGILALHDFGQGSTPDVVADCIAEAITTDAPRLRWAVGQGAERNLRVRASLSDEDWVGVWNDPDDEVFRKTLLTD